MSKYAEDDAYLQYFEKKEKKLSKLDYIILKLEKIDETLKEIKKFIQE